MPRKPCVAGNWKMHMTIPEALELVKIMLPELDRIDSVEHLVCPPFLALPSVAELLKAHDVDLGAQNVHWEDSGAFTGEIAAPMLKPFCTHVIVGHSERRAYFGETDGHVNRRVQAALRHGLVPIVCVGETLAEREAGDTGDVVQRQVRMGLEGIARIDAEKIILAYEPVWAIGTGVAATVADAVETIAGTIRPLLAEMFDADLSQRLRILYGGSVKPSNAADFFRHPDIDGALVGGASLKPEDFIKIVQAAIP